jgi:hypothetical protein
LVAERQGDLCAASAPSNALVRIRVVAAEGERKKMNANDECDQRDFALID